MKVINFAETNSVLNQYMAEMPFFQGKHRKDIQTTYHRHANWLCLQTITKREMEYFRNQSGMRL